MCHKTGSKISLRCFCIWHKNFSFSVDMLLHTHADDMLAASVPGLFEDKELGVCVDNAVKMSAQYAAVV